MLPQELIDGVIQEVDDNGSLKACALVSSTFCGPAQRILLRSLTLKTGSENSPNYGAVARLLTESPHIAAYVTQLYIQFPGVVTTLVELEILYEVFAKLRHVRRCVIDGTRLSARWDDFCPAFTSAVVDSFTGQPLRSLRICSINDIPSDVFLHLITSAATISCFSVSIYISAGLDVLSPALPGDIPSLDHLILDGASKNITEVLSKPQFSPHTANLRRLSMSSQNGVALISMAANTLEHITIDFSVCPTSLPFPPLPTTHSVNIAVDARESTEPWFLSTISGLLSSCATSNPPTLEEIIITHFPVAFYPLHDVHVVFLTALETLFLSRPPFPRLRWILQSNADDPVVHFTYLADLIRRTMHRLHAVGRLAIERSVEPYVDPETLRWEGVRFAA
ncbi:hypothetical protein C8R44DRAFT_865463 [Mycena epipterygia]|nr:hypothetical protein C8R44DRAFT_865463 [Mycena epipterygia]